MTKRRQQRPPRRVQHYIVQPQAYNQVIQLLGTLPYVQVASVLSDLTEGSQAVFEKLPGDEPPPPTPDDQGKIVDNPPDDQPSSDETVEVDGTPPNVVELDVPPPANDDEKPEVETQPKESA